MCVCEHGKLINCNSVEWVYEKVVVVVNEEEEEVKLTQVLGCILSKMYCLTLIGVTGDDEEG